MYAASTVLYLATPLALGSWWAISADSLRLVIAGADAARGSALSRAGVPM